MNTPTFRRLLSFTFARKWVLISVAVSAAASAVDYAVVLGLTHGTPVPIPLAIGMGLMIGASVSFLGNRQLAFKRTSAMRLSVEALRFASAMAVLMVIHGLAAALLRRQGLSVVPSKMTADFFVMGLNQPWVFRRFVFRTSVVEATASAKSPAAASYQP